MIFIICLISVVIALAVYLRKIYSRFSEYGVKCLKPVPFLGNSTNVVLQKCHVCEHGQKLYNAFPEERFVGRFDMMRPVVVVRDLDLIKQVTVKDFEYFIDHRTMVDETVDRLFARNLFSLKGKEWKDMRSTLSPAFTGAKLRAMVPFMIEASEQMNKILKRKFEESESEYIDIDSKELMTRYTNDVIASCAFGIKLDSHTDPENEVYLFGKSAAHHGLRRNLLFLGYSAFPNLMKKFKLSFMPGNTDKYFRNLILNTISEREKNKIFRPDLIHLLIEAKKGNLKHEDAPRNTQTDGVGFAAAKESHVGQQTVNRSWSDIDLCAQAVLFFIAGYEGIASAMSFLLYELAVNPDVQDKLVQEIKENEAMGEFDHNSIQNLKYLDMVVSEILRLWPHAISMDRVCDRNYNLGKPNDQAKEDYIIKKGELISMPIWSIHRDPNYYPDPEKFIPERFSQENRAKIKPFTYMPFGSGPRNCIGSKFALWELKVMVYHLLQQFELSPSEKTRIPAKVAPSVFTLAIEGGHWLRFKRRAP